MTYSLSLVPFIYSISNFIFKFQVLNYVPWISFIGATVTFLYNFLPTDKIVNFIWQNNEEDEYQPYKDLSFSQNSDRMNPITQSNAIS